MDILRIATAGNVDDGKSTLIGRLLYETKSITEDKLEAIERASKRRGVDYTDLSLLTDGLLAEREQGITIDVAHIYFSTATRKYIIADTPGHTEYTRNMITGASTAQVAIILIDARNGLLEQTYRHFYITQLLRIPFLIVCINKMDLVHYAEQRFLEIVEDFKGIAAKSFFKTQNISYIPISSLYGENISQPSGKIDWYKGDSLLGYLESIHWQDDEIALPARFPVQHVIRPKSEDYHDFRGLAGKVISGSFQKGDTVVSLPSLRNSKIENIYHAQTEVDQAVSGQSVVIMLKDDLDISRGDMLVLEKEPYLIAKDFKAQVFWLDTKPLHHGNKYLLQHGSNRVKAKIGEIFSKFNVRDFNPINGVQAIELNEMGQVSLKTAGLIFADPYHKNKNNGTFILIDEDTNNTVGVGFVE